MTQEWVVRAQEVLAAQEADAVRTRSLWGGFGRANNDFYTAKYSSEVGRYWNEFYKRNETRFFKDRHYLQQDFPEIHALARTCHRAGTRFKLLECGCGVGNALFPLVARYRCLDVVAVDLSARAIDLVKEHFLYGTGQVSAHVCNAVKDPLPPSASHLDLVLMLFMLSALAPGEMPAAIAAVVARMRPGGVLLIRDYGRYDYAQLRFAGRHKIGENLYVRQDSTRAYFFDTGDIERLASDAGLRVVECRFLCREYTNRREASGLARVFVHARLQKL